MSYIILIREYSPQDAPCITELVKNAYLSNVNTGWCNAIFKEITFQLIVLTAAIMFIFFGVPLFYCLIAIPVVIIIIYIAIYLSFYTKAIELVSSRRPLKCWVAEVYLPYFFTRDPQTCNYEIVTDEKEIIDAANYQKKVL